VEVEVRLVDEDNWAGTDFEGRVNDQGSKF
jgi:hypothetical protein